MGQSSPTLEMHRGTRGPFLPRYSYAGAVFLWTPVCLSVRPSVRQTRGLWQNETNLCRHPYTLWKVNSSSFRHEEWLVGDVPLYLKFWAKLTPPLQKTAISNRYSLVAPQPLDLAKKSSIITNRKSTTSFRTSLRWTAYVTPNSLPSKGVKNANWPFFPLKVYFSQIKSAAKFFCVKTFSGKVVRHSSLAYLAVHKWLVVDVPFYLIFSTKVTHPILKRRFPIYVHSYRLSRNS